MTEPDTANATPSLPNWATRAIVIVLGTMATWSAAATFLGVTPGPTVAAWLADTLGVSSARAVFAGVFTGLGLAALAVLVPLAIVVNLIRAASRGRTSTGGDGGA